ncbi:MAG TPA: hypothetical protein VFW98_00990, partial [Gemmatimonadaceae bacterium]|nr:hypothetical protein [Gemmatimonadaceae bacterium]
PEGGGMVRIRKLGYAMQTLTVAISPADTAPVTVALTPAVQLPRVTTYGKAPPISPSLRGFEERRAHSATGYFIPDSVLRQEEARTLGDVLLSHVPGIVVIQRGRKLLLEPSSRCTDGGAPDIYVDGVRLVHVGAKHPVDDTQKLRAFANPGARTDGSTPATTPMDLSQFNVTDLAGVEYYPDKEMVPLELRVPTKACGALFLWTREK